MRTSEVMAVGNASDADVTTAAHVLTREVCMSHLLHRMKISYVFTSQDEHNASFYLSHEAVEISRKRLLGLRYCKFTNNFCICKRFEEDFFGCLYFCITESIESDGSAQCFEKVRVVGTGRLGIGSAQAKASHPPIYYATYKSWGNGSNMKLVPDWTYSIRERQRLPRRRSWMQMMIRPFLSPTWKAPKIGWVIIALGFSE